MSSLTWVLAAIAGSLAGSAVMLLALAWIVRARFSRLLRDAEWRLYRQLNEGERGIRPRLEKLERENAVHRRTRQEVQRQAKELEEQKRAAVALTRIAKGLTQNAIQALEREREIGDSRNAPPVEKS